MQHPRLALSAFVLSFTAISQAYSAPVIHVFDEQKQPVATAMITRSWTNKPTLDLSDIGYTPHGTSNQSAIEHNRFTNATGRAEFTLEQLNGDSVNYRVRKPGYHDVTVNAHDANTELSVVLKKLTDKIAIAANKTSNIWLQEMDFEGDTELKKHFQLNCAFCHQQASSFMRNERSSEQWLTVIKRMQGYGARIADDDVEPLAGLLHRQFKKLRDSEDKLSETPAWSQQLTKMEITEYPIGDGFSQMHDFIVHPNGKVYVGDNLQDRIYEVDPESGKYSVYVVPREDDTLLGGILGNRFGAMFPKINNYMGVHSFAISPVDGHIFITPSMQQALLEFDPVSKTFTTHKMDEGYYPHTIRTDSKDRVWFTLATSSQVAMWDRKKKAFKIYDLPARGLKEWAIFKALPYIFSKPVEERPQPSIDRESTGVPMPYGIDVAPDDTVWFSRLYADDIGYIDQETDEVVMIKTPFAGPRRLRADANNNIWIVAFQDSKLAKYDPESKQFTQYELPVVNELPYALNVDRDNGVVWINGNQSDNIFSFDIKTEEWTTYPMPRKRTFTRDIELGEDGSIYTSNSHFPSWQIEDGQPTLIRLKPIKAAAAKAKPTSANDAAANNEAH